MTNRIELKNAKVYIGTEISQKSGKPYKFIEIISTNKNGQSHTQRLFVDNGDAVFTLLEMLEG